MESFLQQILQGLKLGGIYALIALGYTMVYGVLRLINFAHGDVFMLGAMLSIYFARWTGFGNQPSWLGLGATLLFAMAVCGAIGGVIERVAYRPLRNAPRLSLLIAAIGVSLLIENVGQLRQVFGPTPQPFPALIQTKTVAQWGSLTVSNVEILVLLVALGLMAGLHVFVHHTRFGLAMRAVAHDHQTAGLMGIPAGKVIFGTFVLGSALAGAAGVLWGLSYPVINPMTGFVPGIKAFVAAVLGGVGSIPGALLGGFLIGEAESLTAFYLSSTYKDAIAFVILILVLLARPTGLLGRKEVEKV
ncbi:MAG: branched-chain amino acid ABC transporter permease [Verrucomicrobiae bacterium]|nr:branched-chain amino acid ABC transporter permease [Verrucomicrobiae bacterium]